MNNKNRRRYCRIIFLLCISLFIIYFAKFERNNIKKGIFEYLIHEDSTDFENSFPTIITTVCHAKEGSHSKNNTRKRFMSLVSSLSRQIEQVTTMIKSATVSTSAFINFVIAVDEDYVYSTLLHQIKQWPKRVLKKFSIQKRHVHFPSNQEFRSLFRECTTARLFFPDTMTDIDAAIYVDTDVVFMRPPEELWTEFRNFNKVQFSGLAPELSFYNPSKKAPYYGETGLNAGVWMMNFTRMRSYPGGWSERVVDVFEEYKQDIELGDQGIANIIFSKEPQYVYDLGCHWNFRFVMCKNSTNICEEANSKGVYLLHGIGASFDLELDSKATTVYNVWKNFDSRLSLQGLLRILKVSLMRVDGGKYKNLHCSKVPGIDHTLTKGLKSYISLNPHV